MNYFDVLKKQRKTLGFTQEQMAEQIGVSRISYDNWEKGKSPPTVKQWPAIEKAMQLRFMLVAVPIEPVLTHGNYHFSSTEPPSAHEPSSNYKTLIAKHWQLSRVKTPFK